VDLDARIRDADPAGGLTVAPVSSIAARRTRRRALVRSARWRPYALSGGAIAAVIAAALTITGPSGEAPPAPLSPASAVLVRAGQESPGNSTQALTPDGQYFYSETKSLVGAYYRLGQGTPGTLAYVAQPQTAQTWVDYDGSGRSVVTYDGPQIFMTAGRHGWVREAASRAARSAEASRTASTRYGQTVEYGPGLLATVDDLSGLPTDPASLKEIIDTNNTLLGEIVSDPKRPVSPAYTFSTAARILATPALGSSAALRAALCQIMASVPGIELLGAATDKSGRRGIAIVGPVGGDGYSLPGDESGLRDEVIINPSSGAVLQLAQVIADPSLESPEFRKVIGDSAGQVFDWTDYLASGTVASASATPPNQRSENPAA
jgi:hypothetical protein